jgi:hypothetical protein
MYCSIYGSKEVAAHIPHTVLAKIRVMIVPEGINEEHCSIDIESPLLTSHDVAQLIIWYQSIQISSKEESLTWIDVTAWYGFLVWNREVKILWQREWQNFCSGDGTKIVGWTMAGIQNVHLYPSKKPAFCILCDEAGLNYRKIGSQLQFGELPLRREEFTSVCDAFIDTSRDAFHCGSGSTKGSSRCPRFVNI